MHMTAQMPPTAGRRLQAENELGMPLHRPWRWFDTYRPQQSGPPIYAILHLLVLSPNTGRHTAPKTLRHRHELRLATWLRCSAEKQAAFGAHSPPAFATSE